VARRDGIRRAHSATHLLHYALRKHLGDHALQQGSKVDNDLLRFDFANPSAVTGEQLIAIENEVNEKILAGEPVGSTTMPLAEARKSGAMMLFGEKYPDVVRMVSIGSFSKELCGGTHLDNAGKIGLLKIIGEESVAAGTRRITALTGRGALEYVRRLHAALSHTASALRVAPDEVPGRVEAMAKELRQLKKQAAAGVKPDGVGVEQLLAAADELGGVKVVIAEAAGGPQVLRQLIDQLRRKAAPIAIMLGSRQDEDKVLLVAGFSRDLVERGLDAVAWVRNAAALVGGGGGGRADMAQAGGKHPEKLAEALDTARVDLEKLLA
jgi:alanyl-tRNA synthetase